MVVARFIMRMVTYIQASGKLAKNTAAAPIVMPMMELHFQGGSFVAQLLGEMASSVG